MYPVYQVKYNIIVKSRLRTARWSLKTIKLVFAASGHEVSDLRSDPTTSIMTSSLGDRWLDLCHVSSKIGPMLGEFSDLRMPGWVA